MRTRVTRARESKETRLRVTIRGASAAPEVSTVFLFCESPPLPASLPTYIILLSISRAPLQLIFCSSSIFVVPRVIAVSEFESSFCFDVNDDTHALASISALGGYIRLSQKATFLLTLPDASM